MTLQVVRCRAGSAKTRFVALCREKIANGVLQAGAVAVPLAVGLVMSVIALA